jgi:CTP synthase (UTP-ammonia lyase)
LRRTAEEGNADGDLCVGTLRKLFVIVCTARHSHLILSGGQRVMSITIGVELPAHPFFLATLFVPQSRSLPERPHPIVTAFLKVGRGT